MNREKQRAEGTDFNLQSVFLCVSRAFVVELFLENGESLILGQASLIGKVVEMSNLRANLDTARKLPAICTLAVICMLSAVDNSAYGIEPTSAKQDSFAKWEKAIRDFEKQDAANPSASHEIVFVGSSSIRLWDLEKWFKNLDPKPLNRGFGGSQIADATHFAEQLVLKHKPKLIVFYAGDNDLAAGKSGEDVLNDFVTFCELTHDKSPNTRIAFISIKPSPARWKLAQEAKAANTSIRNLCEADDLLQYVDVWTPMIGDNGMPRAELFREDNLHLNDTGYELWTSLIKPHLKLTSSSEKKVSGSSSNNE